MPPSRLRALWCARAGALVRMHLPQHVSMKRLPAYLRAVKPFADNLVVAARSGVIHRHLGPPDFRMITTHTLKSVLFFSPIQGDLAPQEQCSAQTPSV